jgi:hypothetical protein
MSLPDPPSVLMPGLLNSRRILAHHLVMSLLVCAAEFSQRGGRLRTYLLFI